MTGKYAVVTFYPVTSEEASVAEETLTLYNVRTDIRMFFCNYNENADAGEDLVNQILKSMLMIMNM